MPQLSEDDIDRLARKRAGAKLGWYVHAAVYLVVNVGMFAAWQFGLRSRPWSAYPVLGWGLGLVLHGLSVFVLGGGSAWREQLVQRERDRLRREQDRAARR
ncbi:2TM domain-containing protein [Ramlibacter pallidus]|uniref:2TM domain-containing protein n=1 Tax=Ramlibacter pallidus TaxID=2780087 RepID=A0ABR9S4Z6_9BURK|nr:2TM domain-containing protein [Ramlibacter pallidus]MBE7368580.1 2TM domain-containing protein [Ramlibacter pallidus]